MTDVLLGHAFLQRGEDGAEDVEGSVASQAHQFEFVRRLAGAASDGDGIGRDVLKRRGGLPEVVEEREAGGFFYTDASGTYAAIRQCGGGQLCGAFVFLPGTNFEREAEAFAHP